MPGDSQVSFIDKMGGRKVVIGLLFLAATIALELLHGISDNLLMAIQFIVGGFFVGNIGEHIATNFGGKTLMTSDPTYSITLPDSSSQEVSKAQLDPVYDRLHDLQTSVDKLQNSLDDVKKLADNAKGYEMLQAILNQGALINQNIPLIQKSLGIILQQMSSH